MKNLAGDQVEALRKMDNHPFSIGELQSFFRVQNITRKAKELVEAGLITRLKRDLFVVSEKVTGRPVARFVLANRICAPSYVSREAALAYYGMIPELVVNVTSSRLGRTTKFVTDYGTFDYIHVDPAVYSIGLREVKTESSTSLCAGPEKALYDLLMARHNLNIRGLDDLRTFLYDDLRLDVSGCAMDATAFDELLSVGRKRHLIEMLQREVCR